MQEALKNTHYKKIWEKVIRNNNPTAKSLEEALFLETYNTDCKVLHCGLNLIVSMQSLCLLRNSGFHLGDRQYHAFSQSFGRPITLFDILNLLNPNKEDPIYVANGAEIHKIPDGKFCDFTSNLLEEQTPETWEAIANLI